MIIVILKNWYKGLRVRTENIENFKENDSEIFNYNEKYLFKNGNLIKK